VSCGALRRRGEPVLGFFRGARLRACQRGSPPCTIRVVTRRRLAILLLLAPGFAAGQAVEAALATQSQAGVANRQDCGSAAGATWNWASAVAPAVGDRYRLAVYPGPCPAAVPAATTSPVMVDLAATGASQSYAPVAVSGMGAAGGVSSCTAAEDVQVDLCVYDVPPTLIGGTLVSQGTFTFQLAIPPAPVVDSVVPSDSSLTVTVSAGAADATHTATSGVQFVVTCAPSGTVGAVTGTGSAGAISCAGLTNGVGYAVTATAESSAGNPGPASPTHAAGADTTPGIYVLTVKTLGAGAGTVQGGGLHCSSGSANECSASQAEDAVVSLTATATSSSTFEGWYGGGCTGTGPCVVTMTGAQTVTATFAPLLYTLTVVTAGDGVGSVRSQWTSCSSGSGSGCTAELEPGTMVTLTADAGTNSRFTGWSGGGCSGSGSCTVTMSQAQTVTADFASLSYMLTVVTAGDGTGTVEGDGIHCTSGSTSRCSASQPSGSPVFLTSMVGANSRFAGWSGGGCSGTTYCIVTMRSAETVTAIFDSSGGGNAGGCQSGEAGGVCLLAVAVLWARARRRRRRSSP